LMAWKLYCNMAIRCY